jgi:hypothetical protein
MDAMNKKAVVDLIGFILKASVEHGMEIARLVVSKKKIEDSALYEQLPQKRKVEALRMWRKMQRAK